MALLNSLPLEIRPRYCRMLSPFQFMDALMSPDDALEAVMNVGRRMEGETGQAWVIDEKERFGVHVGVDQFKPEELTVRVVENELVVEGKHEESDERGFVSRNFSRRYLIPDNVEKEKLQSRLVNGVLQIEAPKKLVAEEKPKEVDIPITFEKN